MEFLIEKSSNKNDIVADFYGGSYSVPRAAMRLFRRSIGVELNPQTHEAGEELVKKDLHKDPVYGVDWTSIKNIQIKKTEMSLERMRLPVKSMNTKAGDAGSSHA